MFSSYYRSYVLVCYVGGNESPSILKQKLTQNDDE